MQKILMGTGQLWTLEKESKIQTLEKMGKPLHSTVKYHINYSIISLTYVWWQFTFNNLSYTCIEVPFNRLALDIS